MINVHSELKSAKGMVERRQVIVEDIGNEEKVGYAVENLRSMLTCLKECEKHHNRVMTMVDDSNAGVALQTSALVDYSRKWVAQAELNLHEKWGYSLFQIQEIRRQWNV